MHWCHHLQYQYNCMKFLNKSKTKWYFNYIFRDLWQLFLISLVNVFKGNNTNKIQKPLPKTLVKVQKPIYPKKKDMFSSEFSVSIQHCNPSNCRKSSLILFNLKVLCFLHCLFKNLDTKVVLCYAS